MFVGEFVKDLSKNSEKAYKTMLNKLAKDGYDTTAALMAKPLKVISSIKKYAKGPDSEALKTSKRRFVSAIMAVLPDDYRAKPNPYYKYYQTVLPSTDAAGNTWVKKKNYHG
jgi:hypothetical protein